MSYSINLPSIANLLMCLLVSVVAYSSGVQAKESLTVGVPVPGQPPLLWKNEQGQVRGIYVDTLRKVAAQLDVELKFVPISQARLIRLFIAGEIDLELGVSSAKTEPSALASVSLFSRSIGIANEVIIFNSQLSFPAFILKDLKGKRVATVRGAITPTYIEREDFSAPLQIAKRVNRGWSQVGLIREAPALHYKSTLGLNYQISLPYESNPISFRLHKKHKSLLRKINQTLDDLEQQGILEEVICQYLCGS